MNALQAHDRKFAIMNRLLKTKAVKLFKDDNECCYMEVIVIRSYIHSGAQMKPPF